MSGLLKRIPIVGVLLLGIACDKNPPDESTKDPAQSEEAPKRGEQSPNARILPEPLKSGPAFRDKDSVGDDEEEPTAVERWGEPRPYPVHQPIARDTLERGVGAGFEMQFQVYWPEAKKSVSFDGKVQALWPMLRVQLLRALSSQPARMRWILEGPTFPLPEGTELRARSDRIGHLVLWPNGRDYRIAPPGSLHALFSDRRVDRVPFVEHEKLTVGQGSRMGKPTKKHSMKTSVGAVEVDFVPVKELPYASELLCAALFEIARIRANEELCPRAHLPVHFSLEWSNEEKVAFSVLSWGAVANLDSGDFQIPPELPVFKRGELPPFDEFVLDAKARQALLPLTSEVGPPAPAAPSPPPEGPEKGAPPAVEEQPGPPRNQIAVANKSNRPLVVILEQLPAFWLLPGAAKKFYLSAQDIRISARDFLGETVFDERKLQSPAELHFGADADETDSTAELSGP